MSEASVMEAPTVIHVEDDQTWQKRIREKLTDSGVPLRSIISVDTVDAARAVLEGCSGPLIIIVDLRLGNEHVNYEGFMWLLDYMPMYVRGHASAIVFVISGNLHESNTEAIRLRGVPESRQFVKGDWAVSSGSFIAQIRDFVENVDVTALRQMAEGVSASKMDPHLLHAISSIGSDIPLAGRRFPFLVRVRDPELWDSATVPDLDVLSRVGNLFMATGTARSVTTLERALNVIRVEFSRPSGGFDCHESVPFIKASAVHQTLDEQGDQCIVGIIDEGFDILHPAFLDENGDSRILSIWDQRDPSGPSFRKIGTVHSADDIKGYIKNQIVPPGLIGHNFEHGTHVASIAAGRPSGVFAGGVAQAARIALVIADFDTTVGKPSSIGYSLSHILALEFLKAQAESLDLPLVINVSQGMNAGAHDGSSELEKAFDGITGNGSDRGIVVVKSAGNERNQRGHALVQMMARSYDVLEWTSRSNLRPLDSLDVWFDPGDRIRFRLTDPNGESSKWVGWGTAADSGSLSGVSYKMMFVHRDDENGDSRCVINIEASTVPITTGIWQLEMESKEVFSGEIHAWLERDRYRSTEFVTHFSEGMTLSIPGTAHYVISVGSACARLPIRLAEYSSFGPTRDNRKKPEISAPGDPITAVRGGVVNQVVSLSGTSQAAPHVTGAVALLMSYRAKQNRRSPKLAQFNAAQIQKALTQLVQNPGNKWHPGLGFGMIDVEALVREMTGAA